MPENNQLMITDLCAKFYANQWWIWLLVRQCPLKYKECHLKCSLSGRVVRSFEIQVAKAANGQKSCWMEESSVCAPHLIDKLNVNDFQVKSVQIYSRLSLKPMVIGHRGNQISCRERETFVGSNLVLQWVPGRGKVVRGDTKMSPGRVSLGVLQRGVIIDKNEPGVGF